MNTYLKYKPVWFQLAAFGLLTCCISYILASAVLYLVAAIFHTSPAAIFSPVSDHEFDAARIAQGLIALCLWGSSPFLFAYFSDRHPLKYLGFKKPVPPIFWIIGVLLLFVSMPCVAWLLEINQHMHFPASMGNLEKLVRETEDKAGNLTKKFLDKGTTGYLVLNILVFGLIPALVEEVFFRGVLQRLFIRIFKSPFIGIIVGAFIFSAIHFQFLGFLPRFVLGGLLGVLYWYSGSLWPGIIVHFLNNALQVYFVYRNPAYVEQDIHFSAWMIALSSISVVVMIFWMKRISHTHYAEIYDTDDITIESKDGNDQL